VTAATTLAWADELRLGLHGRVRRIWAPVGVKVRQRVQLVYEWRYLALAVDGVTGRLWWQWTTSMRKEAIAPVVAAWQTVGLQALVWDGAPAHRSRRVRGVGMTLITQPAAAPELNPVERVFQELRRAVEGVVYATLEEKMAVVERELVALAADPERVRRLTGWSWIANTLAQLPAEIPASS
jgi:DDE superfamily endonuclease